MGFFTTKILDSEIIQRIAIIMNICLGGILIFWGFNFLLQKLKFCQIFIKKGFISKGAFIIGFITGISICPPFITAGINAFTSGSPFFGVFYFLFFFLGTSIFLLPLFLLPLLKKWQEALNNISRICLFIIGLYFLIFKGVLLL